MNKKQKVYILAIILLILQLFFGKNNPLPKVSVAPTNVPTQVKVIRVIDGDTIEIEGKIKVRYIGVDSPEIYHDSTGKKTGVECFANESYLENKKLVEGKEVSLIKDVSDKDKYGRLLRYVYVEGLFINDYLIKNGYAKLMTIKPDIKYSQQFKEEEKLAQVNNLGLWKKCPN
ncbi:MAG: thermonuclease family protein [Patescibacteria group bacterium]|jgi:micrococcal nuclease